MLAPRDPFARFLKRLNLPVVTGEGANAAWPKEPAVQVLAMATLAGVVAMIASVVITPTRAGEARVQSVSPPRPALPELSPGLPPDLILPESETPEIENAIPNAAGQTLEGYRVTPFFPRAPLTVVEPTRLRSLPSRTGSGVGGLVQPGARLRVNGKVDGPDGPWLQTRLPNGGVGFLQEDVTADLGRWRAQRAAERAAKKEEIAPGESEAQIDPSIPILPTPPPEPSGEPPGPT